MAVVSEHPFRVFISYSHADIEIVRKMAALLEEMGLHPLWDKDIHPGTPFTDTIRKPVSQLPLTSRSCLLLLTKIYPAK